MGLSIIIHHKAKSLSEEKGCADPWVKAFSVRKGDSIAAGIEAPRGGEGGGGEEAEAEAEGVHGWLRRGEPGPALALHGGVHPQISMDVVDETEALQRFFEGK